MRHHTMGLGDKVWLFWVTTLAGKRWKIYMTAFRECKDAFKAWLMRGASEEVIISITPSNLMSWDYRKRMDKELKDS